MCKFFPKEKSSFQKGALEKTYTIGSEVYVLFLLRQEKYQKKATQGDIPKRHVPLRNPCARIASQRPKMFRFLNAYSSKSCRFYHGRRPKIGTFSGVGWRCGWGFQRGRIFVAPLWPTSLVTFLFGDKKVTLPHLRTIRKGIPFTVEYYFISLHTSSV